MKVNQLLNNTSDSVSADRTDEQFKDYVPNLKDVNDELKGCRAALAEYKRADKKPMILKMELRIKQLEAKKEKLTK